MTNKSNELIIIDYLTVKGKLIPTVDARNLHLDIGSKKKFVHWIKIQLKLFTENKDYIIFSDFQGTKNTPLKGNKKRHGHIKSEYFLTLDTAKHIAMMSRTPRGMVLRQYFIDTEEAYIALKYSPEKQIAREEAKVHNKGYNEIVGDFVSYAHAAGSSQAHRYYSLFNDMINHTLFEFPKKTKNVQELLQPFQHNFSNSAKKVVIDIIKYGMDSSVYYKDIFIQCKNKVLQIAEALGVTPVPLLKKQFSLLDFE